MAIARLLELGDEEIGCVSTGNVGTAVSSLAAKAGVAAYVFYPSNLESGKARACRALGAAVIQLDGNYDQANRACRELALATGIQFANITLRPFYAEGAKTMAFEVVEQLDWVSPDHMVIPAAGGTLSSRVHKGLGELETVGLAETAATKIHIAQAEGCAPIATAILDGSGEITPQVPHTAAHSIAIGAPGDGPLVVDAVMSRGGSAATPNDTEIFEAIDLLGATEGILTEPAGGTTVASTMKLAAEGKLGRDDTVVAVISGNGYKTLDEHPDKPWPEMVACEVEAMERTLAEFRRTGAADRLNRRPGPDRRRRRRGPGRRPLLLAGCGGESETERRKGEIEVENAVREAHLKALLRVKLAERKRREEHPGQTLAPPSTAACSPSATKSIGKCARRCRRMNWRRTSKSTKARAPKRSPGPTRRSYPGRFREPAYEGCLAGME